MERTRKRRDAHGREELQLMQPHRSHTANTMELLLRPESLGEAAAAEDTMSLLPGGSGGRGMHAATKKHSHDQKASKQPFIWHLSNMTFHDTSLGLS